MSIILFLLGLVVGSFLNVCIHRLPRDESIVWPASHCPACSKRLGPLELVPIVSFLFLRGKCSTCKTPISWRYPLIELLTGLYFVLCYPLISNPYSLAFSLFFGCLLIVIFFIDLEHQVIPDSLNVIGIVGGFFFNFLNGQIVQSLIGFALGFSLLLLIAKFGQAIFKKEALGEGDLFLAAMLGAWLGWNVLLAVFLSYLIAGVIVFILLSAKKVKFGDLIPFGPFLAAGGLIAFFFGSQIVSWYLGLFL